MQKPPALWLFGIIVVVVVFIVAHDVMCFPLILIRWPTASVISVASVKIVLFVTAAGKGVVELATARPPSSPATDGALFTRLKTFGFLIPEHLELVLASWVVPESSAPSQPEVHTEAAAEGD